MTESTPVTTTSAPGRDDFGLQGFGAMRLREGRPESPDHDPVAVVHAALDAGVTMIDTADAYRNEELVGRAVRGRRHEVLLASKFGLVWRDDPAGDFEVRADPAYVRRACESSLQRLGVDTIDVYYLHHRSETVPIEDTIGAMAELVAQGKIRALGLSNVTAEDLRRAHAVHPVTALQEQWSLARRTIEDILLPTAAELGVTVVAHSPTGHGALHRTRSDASSGRADTVPAILHEIALAHDATVGQIALAWVHHRQPVHDVAVVPLPGTTRVSHVRPNLAAAQIALSDEVLQQLDALGEPDRRC